MKYLLARSTQANRDMDALDPPVRSRIEKKLLDLRDDPYRPPTKCLQGNSGYRSARVGDWRILYSVEEFDQLIVVVRVEHRSKVYRDL